MKKFKLEILPILFYILKFIYAEEVLQLTQRNYKEVFDNHELVFINFYADWCSFSRLIAPEFEKAAEIIKKEFPPEKVIFVKVNCEVESQLASLFQITKYPTLKQIINGKVFKNEYREGRSNVALAAHVRKLLTDPIVPLVNIEDLNSKINETKPAIISYSWQQANSTHEYSTFLKVAKILRDDCNFYWATGQASVSHQHEGKKDFLVFKKPNSKLSSQDIIYTGTMSSFDELNTWATNLCIPLVREIRFDNAEQLTEERLPFMILFYSPEDTESIKIYTDIVKKELYKEANRINFLIADGNKFSYPLYHLGKTKKDLPLIAIDSFKHMYLFPNFQDIHVPNKLKQFIDDLHSEKLHKEFHFGTSSSPEIKTDNQVQKTTLPESSFKNLLPSSNRYTILKDEL